MLNNTLETMVASSKVGGGEIDDPAIKTRWHYKRKTQQHGKAGDKHRYFVMAE